MDGLNIYEMFLFFNLYFTIGFFFFSFNTFGMHNVVDSRW